jgi:predicted metal-binding protein
MASRKIKSYPARWQGELMLACKKCQKKLKKNDDLASLANLKKTVKERNKRGPATWLHIVNVPCMDLCPKDAVAICMPARAADRLMILRGKKDLEVLDHKV